MAVVNVNGISGINSITAQSNALDFYNSAGNTLSIGANLTGNVTGNVTGNATGLSGTPNITVGTIGATSLNASGVVTATSFSGSGANLTGVGGTTDVRTNSLVVSGVSTVTDLRVGTAVTANSNGIQVGAGKSIRLYGATSGFSDIIASSAAGASELTLPNTSGTLDRTNRAGNVLQVVSATYSTEVSSASSTFADTGLTATITPTSATSKILVFVNQTGLYKLGTNTYIRLRLLRGATQLALFESGATDTISSQQIGVGGSGICHLDSPATTSATTYKTQIASNANTPTVYAQAGNCSSTITLMEIAA